MNINKCVILGSHLGHFSQEDLGVLCPLGLLEVQVVQGDLQGSLSKRPKGRRDVFLWNELIRALTVSSRRLCQ